MPPPGKQKDPQAVALGRRGEKSSRKYMTPERASELANVYMPENSVNDSESCPRFRSTYELCENSHHSGVICN
jgi:hypothetical protein